MKVFAGNSNRLLAEAICNYLNVPLGRATVRRFADQEIFVEIQENVRGEDVFVVQSTSFPTNDHLMELLIMIDAIRRSSARRITCSRINVNCRGDLARTLTLAPSNCIPG